jgi:tryptophan synthase alpha chain
MKNNSIKIMCHIVVGYPSFEENKELIMAMSEMGVDYIEMQIPFSDPMADGPAIMNANRVSLENNTKIKDAMELMAEMSTKVSMPLLFMGYFNTIYNYGVERFIIDAKNNGCKGLIFPDIPLDEESSEHFIKLASENNLPIIRVLSPASTDERIEKNAAISNGGFVYLVSRKGTTGSKMELDAELENNIAKVKKYFDLPIAVGFGISTRQHILALRGKADIAVIGSAIINILENTPKDKRIQEVKKFLGDIMNTNN